jgi:uncharacterized protein (DUF4213/DUF364 family)
MIAYSKGVWAVPNLIDELIAEVSQADLQSLHISKISKGYYFTGTMLEDGSCGLCYSLFNQDPIYSCSYLRKFNSFESLDLRKILGFAKNSKRDLERIIGLSCLNAISQHILKTESYRYRILFKTDPIDHITFKKADRVVMIGNIRGFLPKLQALVEEVAVIDDRVQDSELPSFKRLEATQEQLKDATIVFITGSAIANNTLEPVLKWSENAREIAVVGPSAGMMPNPLFTRGVTVLSSMQVMEPNAVLQTIEDGKGMPYFKQYCNKYNILREDR